jgi:hypothetical protein
MSLPAVRHASPKGSLPSPIRLTAGTYLTDEHDLFRCVSVAPAHELGATALLEDCLTLDLLVLPLEDLDAEKLRLVEPEMGGTGLEPVTSCL